MDCLSCRHSWPLTARFCYTSLCASGNFAGGRGDADGVRRVVCFKTTQMERMKGAQVTELSRQLSQSGNLDIFDIDVSIDVVLHRVRIKGII